MLKKILALLAVAVVALGLVVGWQNSARAATIDTDTLHCSYDNPNHPNITGTLTLTTELAPDWTTQYYVTLDLNDDGGPHNWDINVGHDNPYGGGIYDEATPTGSYHKKFGPYGPHNWYDVTIQNLGLTIGCSATVFK